MSDTGLGLFSRAGEYEYIDVLVLVLRLIHSHRSP